MGRGRAGEVAWAGGPGPGSVPNSCEPEPQKDLQAMSMLSPKVQKHSPPRKHLHLCDAQMRTILAGTSFGSTPSLLILHVVLSVCPGEILVCVILIGGKTRLYDEIQCFLFYRPAVCQGYLQTKARHGWRFQETDRQLLATLSCGHAIGEDSCHRPLT